ncbi:MAG: hypothetical protein HQM04_06225 [Magnetococcales bacterium]|nr:hypothetical protein [Magnetococcales bacterium]MBF0114623.1 hypothetical protein [Magnetococcales bacterium]
MAMAGLPPVSGQDRRDAQSKTLSHLWVAKIFQTHCRPQPPYSTLRHPFCGVVQAVRLLQEQWPFSVWQARSFLSYAGIVLLPWSSDKPTSEASLHKENHHVYRICAFVRIEKVDFSSQLL